MNRSEQMLALESEIVGVRMRLNAAHARGAESNHLRRVLDNLERTFSCLQEGKDAGLEGLSSFMAFVDASGEFDVYARGRKLDINTRPLRKLFWMSGVDLIPSQVLLLDPAIARDLVDDALDHLRREEAHLCRHRLDLQQNFPAPNHPVVHEVSDAIASVDRQLQRARQLKVELIAAAFAAEEMMEMEGLIRLSHLAESAP